MSMSWYVNKELGRLRNLDDIHAAENSRLIAEALQAEGKVGFKEKVFGALGAFMIRTGKSLQKQSRMREAINSFMDVSNQNTGSCATC